MWFFSLNIAMLILPVLWSMRIAHVERMDLKCGNFTDPSTCNGDGMSWFGSKPAANDTVETLIRKIKTAANAEVRSIKWRRAFITATVIIYSLVVLSMVFSPGDFCESIPDFRMVYLLLIWVFAILYGVATYVSTHVMDKPRDYIRTAADRIKQFIGEHSQTSTSNLPRQL